MQTLKFTIDIEGNNVRTEGFKKDGNISLHEAGLSHTDLTDIDQIEEYFVQRYGDEYIVIVNII